MTSVSILTLHRADGAAATAALRSGGLGANDPFGPGREIVWEGPAAMAAGRVTFSGVAELASFPHTEALVVVVGSLGLESADGAKLMLGVGAGAVIAAGTTLRVEAEPGTRWVFCSVQGALSAEPGLRELSADAPLEPSAPPPVEALLGPVPQTRAFNAFVDEKARFRAGLWGATPYDRAERPHRVNELMHILEGSVDFVGPDGVKVTAGPGDTVFIPQGRPSSWTNRDPVAKFFVVQEVA